jgi:hypothetical protein
VAFVGEGGRGCHDGVGVVVVVIVNGTCQMTWLHVLGVQFNPKLEGGIWECSAVF